MTDARLDPIIKLPLDQAFLTDVQDQARDFACSHGIIMRTKQAPGSSEVVCHAPFTLIPSPLPRVFFDKAKKLQEGINLLMFRVSQNSEFLTRTLARWEL